MTARPLEIWGGVESTVNRVGDDYVDQLALSCHFDRLEDLDRIAAVGIRVLRYPVLWEHVAPTIPTQYDWRWADTRLAKLRSLGIEPIVGLLHHGSGPRYTSLVDPHFPNLFAEYARSVATRFPWVQRYTPINEPLTTARFSGLYGIWYPHARDEASFFKILINECTATALAMSAIRTVNPNAKLILTEDLGEIHSSPGLDYQRLYENERRWLSMDLLMGRVHKDHPLYDRICAAGVSPEVLQRLCANPCPPEIIGINHYVTSNRYLDERVERFPPSSHGGNGVEVYADVEAVRVAEAPQTSRAELLTKVWRRYGLPVAITECHLYCTREEQMRWLDEAWQEARMVRRSGVDVRAVTVWSLFGTFDWSSLCSRVEGDYEPGVFDLRGPLPRPTILSKMAHELATRGNFEHPVLAEPGWWRRPVRALYPRAQGWPSYHQVAGDSGRYRPILIVGGLGTLARAFARICERRGLRYRVVSRSELEATDASRLRHVLDETRAWAVINAAGYVKVDLAEQDSATCWRDNVQAAATLATVCAERKIPYLTFSSDLVFAGDQQAPYVESSQTHPLNVYGLSKLAAEKNVLESWPESLIIRTSSFFGPWDKHNFLTQTLDALAAGRTVVAASDVWVTPTFVPDLVDASLDLLIDGERGIWHLAHPTPITWADFAKLGAEGAGLNEGLINAVPAQQMPWRAPRPHYSALGSERGVHLGSLDKAISEFLQSYRTQVATVSADRSFV